MGKDSIIFGLIGSKRKISTILFTLFLIGFLVLPKSCLALSQEEYSDLEEITKNLELPQNDVQSIIETFRQIFTTEAMNLWGDGESTDEKTAVVIMLLKASKIEELKFYMKDAPIEITKNIIKGAAEVAQIVLAKNMGEVLGRLEQKTVKIAVDYGIRSLIDNEIRVSPGVINLKYSSYKNEEKEVFFQYIIVFHPLGDNRGKIKIRFYSPLSIISPSPQKHGTITSLPAPDIKGEIPPFIIDISGTVKKDQFDNYQWVDENDKLAHPLINIDFPDNVPDFGIKPSTLLERQIIKPIESTIKEVEIIISKTIGKSLNITEIWNEVKSFISKFSALTPASITGGKTNNPGQSQFGNINNIIDREKESLSITYSTEEGSEDSNKPPSVPIKKQEKKLSLAEIQEVIDDISEKIDSLRSEINKSSGKGEDEKEKLDVKKNIEDDEQEEDSDLSDQSDEKKKEEVVLCEKKGDFLKNHVVFNEIAWMGTEISSNDEWIELKNLSGNTIDLAGWQIFSKDKQIKIFFINEVILPNGLLLLERTDDNSVPGTTADLIYSGGIKNSNESLLLFDKGCQLQDEAVAGSDWPAGENSSKRTMERKANFSWQTSLTPAGTPKAENTSGYYQHVFSGGGSSIASSKAPSQPLLKVLINEIQIASASSTNDEFIELFNPNDQEADISQWSIQKSYSTSTNIYKKNFENNSKIPAKGYFLIVNSSSTDQALLGSAGLSHKVFNLASNNSVYLVSNQEEISSASDTDIVDLVGFGQGVFSEKNPAPNPSTGNSIGRRWSTTSQGYLDQDDNLADFEMQTPTPGGENTSLGATTSSGSQTANFPLSVVINEISWMGASASNTSDEWIELYNNSSSSLDLTGWKIKKSGEEFITISSSTVSGYGFYLLERSSSASTDIVEDNIYVGSLKNDGEKLELIAPDGTLIDEVNCSSGWFAGTASPLYISMERIDPALQGNDLSNWESNNLIIRNGRTFDGKNINGTPRSENSVSMSPTTVLGLPFNEFSEVTLTYHGSPYIVKNRLPVGKGKLLKIEKGVILRFDRMSGIEVQGRMEAIGGPENEEKIVFTSLRDDSFGGDLNLDGPSDPGPGDWDWLFFQDSSGSILKNTIIKYGSAIYGCFPCCACMTKGMVNVENGEITIEDSLIEKSQTVGLWLVNSSTTINNVSFLNIEGVTIDSFNTTAGIYIEKGNPTIRNSYFSGNKFGIKILSGANPLVENNLFENNLTPIYFDYSYPVFRNNQARNNGLNGIAVGPTCYGKTTWHADLPYVVEYLAVGDMPSNQTGETLTLQPGVIIKFAQGLIYRGLINVSGRIFAKGTDSDPVIFTSLYDDEHGGDTNNDSNSSVPNKGDWLRVDFYSPGSYLENVIMKYAGSEGPFPMSNFGAITIEEGDGNMDLTIKNSEISDSVYGVYFSGRCDKFPNIYLENNNLFNNTHNYNCP